MRYNNIFDAFNGSVWYIDEGKLDQITTLMENIFNDGFRDMQAFMDSDEEDDRSIMSIKDGIATIEIRGTLFPRANLMTQHSGATSYQMIQSALKQALGDDMVQSIVLDIDSGGGSVHGTVETASLIREIAAQKDVTTVFTGLGASAAYFIGSAANQVYATPTALVGNIGTVMVLRDISGALEERGIKFKVIRSTKLKGIGNPVEPLTQDAVDEFQRLVNKFNEQFVQNVALNQNISLEQARKMADARVHIGQEAVELGFVDGILTLDQVMESLGADATLEDKFTALSQAYVAVQESFDTFQLRANEQFAVLAEGLKALQEKQNEEKIDMAVAELTEGPQARFPLKMADQVREALSNDFDVAYKAFTMMPVGAGAPSTLELKDKQVEPVEDEKDDPVAHAEAYAKEHNVLVAYDAEEAKVYDILNRKYVEAY